MKKIVILIWLVTLIPYFGIYDHHNYLGMTELQKSSDNKIKLNYGN